MRLPPAHTLINGLAWLVLAGFGAAAVVLVTILGPFGLVLLGLATLLVCTMGELDESTPLWRSTVLRPPDTPLGSPEQRAAIAEQRQTISGSYRFYRRCGFGLAMAGVALLAWQHWR